MLERCLNGMKEDIIVIGIKFLQMFNRLLFGEFLEEIAEMPKI
jgi:hypothetical protein